MLSVASIAVVVVAARSRLDDLRRIVRESLPILLAAATLSTLAGIALEKRFALFDQYPALLVLVPAHLSSAGALGGILSGRVSTKLLLGTAEPTDLAGAVGPGRHLVRRRAGAPGVRVQRHRRAPHRHDSSGRRARALGSLLAVSLIGGAVAIVFVAAVAYVAAIVSVRTGRRSRHLRHPGGELDARRRGCLQPHPHDHGARDRLVVRESRHRG